jgi:monofunctional biosynthetic peptidoglycan transglycosylase
MKKFRRALRWVGGGSAVAFAYLTYVYLTLPDVRSLVRSRPATTAFMDLRARDAAGAGQKPRRMQSWVRLSQISPHLQRAVVISEDAAFWGHEGVDFDEIRASIEVNFAEAQFVRGASTITQQLAKNLYLSPSRNPVRKVRELIIARRLEAELSKARILEIYLNVIEWGDGVYGIEAASRQYFGVAAADLDQAQAALLAGAIINPRALSPARPNARLLARQRLILRRMGATSVRADGTR